MNVFSMSGRMGRLDYFCFVWVLPFITSAAAYTVDIVIDDQLVMEDGDEVVSVPKWVVWLYLAALAGILLQLWTVLAAIFKRSRDMSGHTIHAYAFLALFAFNKVMFVIADGGVATTALSWLIGLGVAVYAFAFIFKPSLPDTSAAPWRPKGQLSRPANMSRKDRVLGVRPPVRAS